MVRLEMLAFIVIVIVMINSLMHENSQNDVNSVVEDYLQILTIIIEGPRTRIV